MTCTHRASNAQGWLKPLCHRCLRPRSMRRNMREVALTVSVNGEPISRTVEARRTLADFLRDDLRLTGTHLGCEHGVCGACTVMLNGAAVRSCLIFAVQAEAAEVTTVEGLTPAGGALSPVQQAF